MVFMLDSGLLLLALCTTKSNVILHVSRMTQCCRGCGWMGSGKTLPNRERI